MFGYGFDGFCQQRIVGFQFPDMEKSFCNSFLNCYVDDFTFAMELEKELFFEQTLPWLDNVCSIQAYADWRMKIMYKRPVQLRNILDSIWSQMMVKNWENMRAWEDYWKEDPYLSYWKEHEEGKIAFGIQDAISRQDERTLDLLLHENHMNNMQNLKAFCPRLYEQI